VSANASNAKVGAAIDSNAVNRALRALVWPELDRLGFVRRTARTAWRDREAVIHVFNFQSFNRDLADLMGTTTFSFSVNVGVFYPEIANISGRSAFLRDPLRPQEPQCQARRHLAKGIAQSGDPSRRDRLDPHLDYAAPRAWVDRPDVWLVLADGSNVESVVIDARDRVLADGIPRLERLSDLGEARRHFAEVPDSTLGPGIQGEQYGGRLGSPNRLQSLGALSAVLGDEAGLRAIVGSMRETRYFVEHPAALNRLMARLD
jgi:hypothetical protein